MNAIEQELIAVAAQLRRDLTTLAARVGMIEAAMVIDRLESRPGSFADTKPFPNRDQPTVGELDRAGTPSRPLPN